jgi:hypothetical protein
MALVGQQIWVQIAQCTAAGSALKELQTRDLALRKA